MWLDYINLGRDQVYTRHSFFFFFSYSSLKSEAIDSSFLQEVILRNGLALFPFVEYATSSCYLST